MTQKEKKAHFGYSKAHRNTHKPLKALQSDDLVMKPVAELPTSVDWRTHYPTVVSPVKDQGHCGSCWAFAATAVIESHVAIQSGLLFSLAPQQIASCSPNPLQSGGTGGCEGATCQVAFDYAASSAGLYQEFQYPYVSYGGEDQTCYTTAEPEAYIGGYHQLAYNNYTELMNGIAQAGPIAVSVDASAWSTYQGGVFTGGDATNPVINHAVTLVGYGEEEGQKYWLVRNSWSPAWGEGGYIKLARSDDDDNKCGMDVEPLDGSACANVPGSDAPVKVCGQNGILSDSSFPTGAGAFWIDEGGRTP
jgi:cathepsin L